MLFIIVLLMTGRKIIPLFNSSIVMKATNSNYRRQYLHHSSKILVEILGLAPMMIIKKP